MLIAGDRVENGEKTMRERLGDGSSLLRRNLNKSFTLYAVQKKRSAEIATAPRSPRNTNGARALNLNK